MKEAAARRLVEYISTEMQGVGILGNFVSNKTFGYPQADRAFQGFISAGITAYAALMTPGIGPLAMAGNSLRLLGSYPSGGRGFSRHSSSRASFSWFVRRCVPRARTRP
jgi:hypothetical protein